ncbi:MAG: type II secretion system protein [Pirellulales bacterium]
MHKINHHRRALTLIEVVASTMIVGLMSVAALDGLGAATRSAESIGNRAIALGLADDLMAEILPLAYSDPNDTPAFGTEGSEASGPRSGFDDVDDFNGWTQMPPTTRDGVIIPNRADWRRSVLVVRVVPTNLAQATSGTSDQGAKRIRVTVEYRGQLLATQIAVRTDNK